jgi:hypothetical protein
MLESNQSLCIKLSVYYVATFLPEAWITIKLWKHGLGRLNNVIVSFWNAIQEFLIQQADVMY